MAVAAVEQIVSQKYIAVDDVAELRMARDEVRDQAWQTIEERRALIQNGESEYVPPIIDALSTAQSALQARNSFGELSDQYQTCKAGLELDCLRLVSEWYRKNTAEYFPEVTHSYDPITQDYYSHGVSTGQLTQNALTPQLHPEEEVRRVNERVEEVTPQLVQKLGNVMLQGAQVRTISECPDYAIDAYWRDRMAGQNHRGYYGYVPEIQKVMVRGITPTANGRSEEQVALPGTYITHEVIQSVLVRQGLAVADATKTEMHATQFIATDNLLEDFVPLLDAEASEQWCVNIFMGEVVADDHPKDYAAFRHEAVQRQHMLSSYANTVASFVLDLAEQGTSSYDAPAIVEAFVKKMLLTLARSNNAVVVHVFDDATARRLQNVAFLESMGEFEAANAALADAERQAPSGGYCGAGSCGLELVGQASGDANEVKKLGFSDAKDVIKDTVRTCPCGKKTVFYDIKQGRKGCTSCRRTVRY